MWIKEEGFEIDCGSLIVGFINRDGNDRTAGSCFFTGVPKPLDQSGEICLRWKHSLSGVIKISSFERNLDRLRRRKAPLNNPLASR